MFLTAIAVVLSLQTTNATPKSKLPTWLSAPFVMSEHIPPNFKGTNLHSVVDALIRRDTSLMKNEFETTDEYKLRAEKIDESPIAGSLKIDDRMAFVFSTPYLDARYEADKSYFSVRISVDPPVSGIADLSDTRSGSLCLMREKKSRDYNATNVYGAVVTVHSEDIEESCIAISQSISISSNDQLNYVWQSFAIDVSRDQAKDSKERMRVLVSGHVIDRQVRWGEYEHKSTFKDPIEYRKSCTYIMFSPDQVSVFDIKTGNILDTRIIKSGI